MVAWWCPVRQPCGSRGALRCRRTTVVAGFGPAGGTDSRNHDRRIREVNGKLLGAGVSWVLFPLLNLVLPAISFPTILTPMTRRGSRARTTCRLSRGDVLVKHRPQLIDLLICLAKRPGELVLRDEIMDSDIGLSRRHQLGRFRGQGAWSAPVTGTDRSIGLTAGACPAAP